MSSLAARADAMDAPVLDVRAMLAYGLPGLPLAFLALPIYVHVPQLYSLGFGMSLASVGAVLLLARCADACIDPLIGVWSDRWAQRKRALLCALPLMLLGCWGLLMPPATLIGIPWMVAMLLVVYAGYSLASVNHNAWGAELARNDAQRTRLNAMREGCGLLGVVLASVLPTLAGSSVQAGAALLAMVFATLALPAVLAAVMWAPEASAAHTRTGAGLREDLLRLWRAPGLRSIFLLFALNGIAAAIPASLVLFFIADVLQASRLAGVFLALYFIAAALGLPLWVALARRLGLARAWMLSMLLAIFIFAWAALLDAGDVLAFALICAGSGVALGADLCLPPSLLAARIERARVGAGAAFGCWNFVSKLNLALAAGCSLPLLQWLGYQPGSHDTGVPALSAVYALLPALLKLVALGVLWRARRLVEPDQGVLK